MEDNLSKKKELVKEVKEKIEKSTSIVFVDYKGLNVSYSDRLRVKFKENNAEYKVYKNRIMLRALTDLGITGVDEHFNGTTSVAFGYDSEVIAANLLNEVAKETKTMAVKFGILNGKIVDKDYVKRLADIPGYDSLMSQMLSVLSGPITNLAIALKAISEKE